MHHHNQHDKIGLVGVVTVAMLVGLFAGGTRARAQSLDDPPAPASDSSPDDRAILPNAESATIDPPDMPSASDGAISTNDADDSAAPAVSDNADVEYAPPGSASGSSEASGIASENGAVLEIPQVVNLQNGGTANVPVDEASANPDGNDDGSAQSSQGREDTAGNPDLAAMAGPVGTLADYQNQSNEAPPGAIFFVPPVAIVRFPRPAQFNSISRPLFGAPMVMSPIILPPTSSGPFPSTSPMLMGPRFGTFGLSPRGGLMGAHR